LQKLHKIFPSKRSDFSDNDREAILTKTFLRLKSVSNLVPGANKDYIIINGKKCINFLKQWRWVETYAKTFFNNEYKFIHGDITFSNTLYETTNRKIYFIDPRGYYGSENLFGDEDYDWAKLYYSIRGDYDQLNIKNFKLNILPDRIILNIKSNGWRSLEKLYFKLINRSEAKIRFFHAIIWLSLTSYAWDDYDTICAAFYNGMYLMQEIYENAQNG
jgi:hypothetical protein